MTASRAQDAQDDVLSAMESFVARHEASESSLVREHLAFVRQQRLAGAPLGLAIGRAVGLAPDHALAVAVVAGFTEAAALALHALDSETYGVRQGHDLPLALNSADALYSLAHLALNELEAGAPHLSARFDRRSRDLWEALAGETALSAASAAARMAAELATAATGAPETAIIGVGSFAAEIAAGGNATASLAEAGLAESARAALTSLADWTGGRG